MANCARNPGSAASYASAAAASDPAVDGESVLLCIMTPSRAHAPGGRRRLEFAVRRC